MGLLEIMTLIVDGLYACSSTYAKSSSLYHLVRLSPAFSVSVSAELKPSGGAVGQKLRCTTANLQIQLLSSQLTVVGLTLCVILGSQDSGYHASNVPSLHCITCAKSQADDKFVDESGNVVNSKVLV